MRNIQKIVWLVKVEISKSDLSGWAVFTFGEDEATLVQYIVFRDLNTPSGRIARHLLRMNTLSSVEH